MEGLLPNLNTVDKVDIQPDSAATEDTWYRLLVSENKQNDTVSCVLNIGNFYGSTTPRQLLIHIGVSGYTKAMVNILSSSPEKPITKIRFVKKQSTTSSDKLYVDVNRVVRDKIHISACSLINAKLVDNPYNVTSDGIPEGYTEEIVEL